MNDWLHSEDENSIIDTEQIAPNQQEAWEDIFKKADELCVADSYTASGYKSPTRWFAASEVNSVLYRTPSRTNFCLTEIDDKTKRLDIKNLYTPVAGKIGYASFTMEDGVIAPAVMVESTEIGVSPIIDDICRLFVVDAHNGMAVNFGHYGVGEVDGIITEMHNKDHLISTIFVSVLNTEKVTFIEMNGEPIVLPLSIKHRLKVKKETKKGYTKYQAYKGIKHLSLINEV